MALAERKGFPEVRGTSKVARCCSGRVDDRILTVGRDNLGGDALEFGGEFRQVQVSLTRRNSPQAFAMSAYSLTCRPA